MRLARKGEPFLSGTMAFSSRSRTLAQGMRPIRSAQNLPAGLRDLLDLRGLQSWVHGQR
jgi:hypothetical protein